MVKYFCDVCEAETPRNYVTDRYKGLVHLPEKSEIGIEITFGFPENKCSTTMTVWNSGVLCKKCFVKILLKIVYDNSQVQTGSKGHNPE